MITRFGPGRFGPSSSLSGASLDSDAIAWKTRVVDDWGGSVSSSTMQAVSNFCTSCKTAGVWTKLHRVNLFCGDQLTACTVPLKVGSGSAVESLVNFVSGDYTESTGLTGDGGTKYLDTGFSPGVSLSAGDTHFSVYNRSSVAASCGIGCSDVNGIGIAMFAPWGDGNYYDEQYTGAQRVTVAITGPFGYLLGTVTGLGTGLHKSYKNGSLLGSGPGVDNTLPTSTPMYMFAKNFDGTPGNHSNYSFAGYTIGTGLSASDVTALTTVMEAFQDALGRGVA